MKYYKTPNNQVYAYEEDGSQNDLIEQAINNGWELLTQWPLPKNDEQLKKECSDKAKGLIAQTDWAVLPDVGLKNTADFVTYRGILRGLIISPVISPDFPVAPTAIWQ
jgi:hypothetical protein